MTPLLLSTEGNHPVADALLSLVAKTTSSYSAMKKCLHNAMDGQQPYIVAVLDDDTGEVVIAAD